MTVFTHALSQNNYGNPKFIVATSAANGTHTTLASALAVASSGDTILLRDSVTENVTLIAGVNIVALVGSESTPTVSITGKLSFAAAGTVTIAGIRLTTNSDNFLAVTGSAASIVNLNNCYLNCLNATGISFTTANVSSLVNLRNCAGNIGTTGISLYSSSATGTINIQYCSIANSGATVTASTLSAGAVGITHSDFFIPLSSSSTGVIMCQNTNINTLATNTTSFTTAGTGASHSIQSCNFASGSASSVSIGAGTTVLVNNLIASSSNANPVTGAGAINYSNIMMASTGLEINTTTSTGQYVQLGKSRAQSQPAFLAIQASVATNVTGDGSIYTLGSTVDLTEIFDQNSNFDPTTGTFTAPVTGRYNLFTQITTFQGTATTSYQCTINTSNRICPSNRIQAAAAVVTQSVATTSSIFDMDAADTATAYVAATDTGGKILEVYGEATNMYTYFSGHLVC